MPEAERICPQCQEKILVETDDQRDVGQRDGRCPHCHVKIIFEHRTSFTFSAPLEGGAVVRIKPR